MSDNWIVQNLERALETWNEKLAEIWQLITQSPETFKSDSKFSQDGSEQSEHRFNHTGICQLVAEIPNGFCIRQGFTQHQAQKPHKRDAAVDMELHLVARYVA